MLSPKSIRNAFPQSATWVLNLESHGVALASPPEILGQGRFSEVLAATYNGDDVAAKKILGKYFDTSAVGRGKAMEMVEDVRRECEILSRLDPFPHIVRFHGVAFTEEGGLPILVMEKMKETLRQHIGNNAQRGGVPLSRCIRFSCEICKALRFLHHDFSHRIVHRDLSSTNILLDEFLTCKVADVGIARCLDEVSRIHSTAPGHRSYMPTEALVGRKAYNQSIDIYSVGVLMLEMCIGRVPEPSPATADGDIDDHVRVIPDVKRLEKDLADLPMNHDDLRPLILRCLERSAERPTAADLLYALQRLMVSESSGRSRASFHTSRDESDIMAMKRRVLKLEEEMVSVKQIVQSQDSVIRHLTGQVSALQSALSRSPSLLRRSASFSNTHHEPRVGTPAVLVGDHQWEFVGSIPLRMISPLCFPFVYKDEVHFITEARRDASKLQLFHFKLLSSGVSRESTLEVTIESAPRQWNPLRSRTVPALKDIELCGVTEEHSESMLSTNHNINIKLHFAVQSKQCCDICSVETVLTDDGVNKLQLTQGHFQCKDRVSYRNDVIAEADGLSSPCVRACSDCVPEHRLFPRSNTTIIGQLCAPSCRPDTFFNFPPGCSHDAARTQQTTFLHGIGSSLGNLIYVSDHSASHIYKHDLTGRDMRGDGFSSTWKRVDHVLLPHCAGMVVHKGGIIFAGGKAEESTWESCLDSVSRFEISGSSKKITAKTMSSLPKPCSSPTLVFCKGYLYCIGGLNSRGQTSNEVYRLELDND